MPFNKLTRIDIEYGIHIFVRLMMEELEQLDLFTIFRQTYLFDMPFNELTHLKLFLLYTFLVRLILDGQTYLWGNQGGQTYFGQIKMINMINNELNRAESIPDICYFCQTYKYNRKVDKEIKKLEVLESLLVQQKKMTLIL